MKLLEARRLTGPNLLADLPGAVLDVSCTAAEAERLVPAWQNHVARMLADLGWEQCQFRVAQLAGGVSLFFTAAIDALYAATAISEWAWAAAEAELEHTAAPDYVSTLAAIQDDIESESNPALLQLQSAAAARQVAFLWDDDHASLGLGRHAETWPARQLPAPGTIDWPRYRDIPVALVTGTNGKTTTVRLAAHILRKAGRNVGLSSTEWIAVNDRIIDRGDWSGPGGARAVLRETSTDIAILEAARGGLLRRGLGVNTADVALITNIAADHLGDFGSQSLDELLDIKWIVSRAVAAAGRLILNADDELLCARAAEYPAELLWFSLHADNATVRAHCAGGGTALVLDGRDLLLRNGAASTLLCRDDEIPITLGGAARHNVANALAAAALSYCLGATPDDIRAGLTSMSQDDNPGRCNVYAIGGRTVLVDFAHNPHAMRALFDMAQALPAKRRVLCFGQAGDRPDAAIRELARQAWAIGLDKIIVSELPDYYRGRAPGEVYALIRDELLHCGAGAEQVEHCDEELDSLAAAMAWAEPGDLVIMLALADATAVRDHLKLR